MDKPFPKFSFLCMLVLVTVFNYGNQLLFHYLVPPGGDASNHDVIVQEIFSGKYSGILNYHTLWHVTVGLLAKLVNTPSITVMAWLGPALLVSASLAVFFFNKRYFGYSAGIASMLLLGLFSMQPYQTLYDGGFPNVLAAGTVLPLILMLFLSIFTAEKRLLRFGLFLLLFPFLIYSHHLTTIYTVVIIIVFLCCLFVRFLAERNVNLLTLTLGGVIFLIASVALTGYILNSPHFETSTTDLLSQFLKIDTQYPYIHLLGKLENANAIWPLAVYPNGIGEAVVYLGLGGFLVAFIRLFLPVSPYTKNVYLLLLIWTLVLFVGSRLESLGFPVRLARELVIPLVLLAGLAIHEFAHYVISRKLPIAFLVIFIILCLTLGSRTFSDRYKRSITPNTLVNHLPVDTVAANYMSIYLPFDARVAVPYDNIYLDSFTPFQTAVRLEQITTIRYLIDPQKADPVFENYDYLYLERRFDREGNEINTDDLINTYKQSPRVTLLATFSQPQKQVYLFKINKPLKGKTTSKLLH